MKRILTTAALLIAAIGNAGAQYWQDAYAYSENNYVGTARSVGMGNAMTAVGGDLGSLTFNPAGSAVSGYSQFTLTPSLSISSTFSQGTPLEADGDPFGFEDGVRSRYTRFKLPNFGVVTTINTHNTSGLKRFAVGIVGNATNDYTRDISATGTNGQTSLAGALASQAQIGGWSTGELGARFENANAPWMPMVGYQSAMFSPVYGTENAYAGATERVDEYGNIQLAGRLNQNYGQRNRGNKYDVLLNFAADFSDRFYIGANLGITTLSYRQDTFFGEDPVDPDNFVSTYIAEDGTSTERRFRSLQRRTAYLAEGTGVYAKAGFIWRPVAGLRLGAAIQTPTVLDIQERYSISGRTEIDERSYSAQTPEDEWYYCLRTPYRVNAGVAYTLGSLGMLSVDYELCDYSTMRFGADRSGDYYYDFSAQNQDIKANMKASHTLRIGAEIKPMPSLAIRTGYNYISSPLVVDSKASRQNVSFGLGYSSGGSFFADASVRVHYLPYEYLLPYEYAGTDSDGYEILTPEICMDTRLWDVLLTFGWRF